MSIFSGDAVEAGALVAGIFIPGVWICGEALGLTEGVGTFMSISSGDAGGFGRGELVGICIPGM